MLRKLTHKFMLFRIRQKLKLDNSQQQKLEQLKARMVAADADYHHQHRRGMQELHTLLSHGLFNRERAADLFQTQLNQAELLGEQCIDGLVEFIDSLDSHQRQHLGQLLARPCLCLH